MGDAYDNAAADEVIAGLERRKHPQSSRLNRLLGLQKVSSM